MDRFVSKPIDVPDAVKSGDFYRADLIFYGVQHRRNSFRANVFLDVPGEDPDVSPDRTGGYAGHFTIFGHGGCVGADESHCDPRAEPPDPFDTRPAHALEPQTKFIEVTDALRQIGGDQIVVTVLPLVRGEDGPQLGDQMTLTGARLLVYRKD